MSLPPTIALPWIGEICGTILASHYTALGSNVAKQSCGLDEDGDEELCQQAKTSRCRCLLHPANCYTKGKVIHKW